MMAHYDFKPCSSCGKIPEMWFSIFTGKRWAQCACGNSTMAYVKKETVVKNWNKKNE